MSCCLCFAFRLLRGTISRALPETGISTTRWKGLQPAISASELCLLVAGVARARACDRLFRKKLVFESSSDNHESDVKNGAKNRVKQHKLCRFLYKTSFYLRSDW